MVFCKRITFVNCIAFICFSVPIFWIEDSQALEKPGRIPVGASFGDSQQMGGAALTVKSPFNPQQRRMLICNDENGERTLLLNGRTPSLEDIDVHFHSDQEELATATLTKYVLFSIAFADDMTQHATRVIFDKDGCDFGYGNAVGRYNERVLNNVNKAQPPASSVTKQKLTPWERYQPFHSKEESESWDRYQQRTRNLMYKARKKFTLDINTFPWDGEGITTIQWLCGSGQNEHAPKIHSFEVRLVHESEQNERHLVPLLSVRYNRPVGMSRGVFRLPSGPTTSWYRATNVKLETICSTTNGTHKKYHKVKLDSFSLGELDAPH